MSDSQNATSICTHLYFEPETRSSSIYAKLRVGSRWRRWRELLSSYKLGAKWRETVRCSTREDIAAMYRITGTRSYFGHGRIVGMAAAITIAVVSTEEEEGEEEEEHQDGKGGGNPGS